MFKKLMPLLILILIIYIFGFTSFTSAGTELIVDLNNESDDFGFANEDFSLNRQGWYFGLRLKIPDPQGLENFKGVFFSLYGLNVEFEYSTYPLEKNDPKLLNVPINNNIWKYQTKWTKTALLDDEFLKISNSSYQVLLNTLLSIDILYFKITKFAHPAFIIFSFYETDVDGIPSTSNTVSTMENTFKTGNKIPLSRSYGINIINPLFPNLNIPPPFHIINPSISLHNSITAVLVLVPFFIYNEERNALKKLHKVPMVNKTKILDSIRKNI